MKASVIMHGLFFHVVRRRSFIEVGAPTWGARVNNGDILTMHLAEFSTNDER